MNVIKVAALFFRILLIVAGLHGFALTLFMEKPRGNYFFACAIVMIAILGPTLSTDKRPRPLVIMAAMILATAAQQIVLGFLAPHASRLWLTLQFLSLQLLMVGVMVKPKGGAL